MVIDHLGNQKGVMPLSSALSIARENNLDLVQISDGKDYPICKILDFGKYLYQKQKKRRVIQILKIFQTLTGWRQHHMEAPAPWKPLRETKTKMRNIFDILKKMHASKL